MPRGEICSPKPNPFFKTPKVADQKKGPPPNLSQKMKALVSMKNGLCAEVGGVAWLCLVAAPRSPRVPQAKKELGDRAAGVLAVAEVVRGL